MEWIKGWLLSITCAAVIAALASALCPEGFPKKLTRSAGGLLLLLAVLGPARQLNNSDMTDILAKYQTWSDGAVEAMAQDDQEIRKAIIARQTAAYISDKATALGIRESQVWVSCRMTGDGFPAPESVTVRGSGTDEAWQALQRAITADFGLENSAQTLERMDVP